MQTAIYVAVLEVYRSKYSIQVRIMFSVGLGLQSRVSKGISKTTITAI